MSEEFVIEEFEMLSTAKQQWRALGSEQKNTIDLLILDWINGKTKARFTKCKFKLGELILIELAETHFILFFEWKQSLIIVDFGELYIESNQALAS
jgi:hypothetical protein